MKWGREWCVGTAEEEEGEEWKEVGEGGAMDEEEEDEEVGGRGGGGGGGGGIKGIGAAFGCLSFSRAAVSSCCNHDYDSQRAER